MGIIRGVANRSLAIQRTDMNATGLIIGGVIPAIGLGLGTVLMRASVGEGATIPTYLAVVGTTIAIVGWGAILLGDGATFTTKASFYAAMMGITWSIAIACIAYGFGVLKLPVSIIAPLTNSNALVALAVGAVVFSEWKSMNLVTAGIGTALICAGATIVSLSK
jgi:transporter family protein